MGSVLFVVYLVILVWIILFKLHFSLNTIDRVRGLNLIPFHYSVLVGGRLQLRETIQNILIFVPFGIYLCMLKPNLRLWTKISMIAGLSFALETSQYILAIGRTDITDLIANTLGGIIGIGFYHFILRLFKNRQKINTAITIAATISTVLLLGLLAVLLVFN